MVIGRWWPDETAEVDVLGLVGGMTALLGECRWQAGRLTGRDLTELHQKIAFVPEPGANPTLMFWTRTGMAEPEFPAEVFSATT